MSDLSLHDISPRSVSFVLRVSGIMRGALAGVAAAGVGVIHAAAQLGHAYGSAYTSVFFPGQLPPSRWHEERW